MTFLELCQMVARESGTISGNQPAAVTSQTGRLLKVVNWTATAWTQIQNSRNAWRWMRGEWSGNTTAPAARYTPASWTIPRHAEWVIWPDGDVTIYDPAIGQSDEGWLAYLDWRTYRRLYGTGVHQAGKPVHYAISPAGEFCVGPTPDKAYTIRGEYRKTTQTLSANNDVPELPARFHELIAWGGLLLLAEHDEGVTHIAVAQRRYRELMGDLERDQLPRLAIDAAAPLA